MLIWYGTVYGNTFGKMVRREYFLWLNNMTTGVL